MNQPTLRTAIPADAERCYDIEAAAYEGDEGALRRWVWNSPPELGQDMTSTTTGGMTWTAPGF